MTLAEVVKLLTLMQTKSRDMWLYMYQQGVNVKQSADTVNQPGLKDRVRDYQETLQQIRGSVMTQYAEDEEMVEELVIV